MYTLKDHTKTVKFMPFWDIIAHSVSEDIWHSEIGVLLQQDYVARLYWTNDEEINGYIFQRQHTTVGSLGAFYLPKEHLEPTDTREAKLEKYTRGMCRIEPRWQECRFTFCQTKPYNVSGDMFYTLHSAQMRTSFAHALAATGLSPKFAGSVTKDIPLHPAERVTDNDRFNEKPLDWQPVSLSKLDPHHT